MEREARSDQKERTYSVVMTTLQSQSLTLSLNDSALNPANTAEWTAPILAQARNAAVACHVIGRLGVSLNLGNCSLSPFSPLVTFVDFGKEGRRKEGKKGRGARMKEGRRKSSCCTTSSALSLDLLDRNSIPLLNPPRLKYISNLTSLLHQFPKTNFSRFGGFIRFVDYGCFIGVGVEMSV
jgi:hypothetical protein